MSKEEPHISTDVRVKNEVTPGRSSSSDVRVKGFFIILSCSFLCVLA